MTTTTASFTALTSDQLITATGGSARGASFAALSVLAAATVNHGNLVGLPRIDTRSPPGIERSHSSGR
jgi:hypothetical protein